MSHQDFSYPMPIQLTKGMKARVNANTATPGPNIVHKCPIKEGERAEYTIPVGDVVTILDGPVEDLRHGLRYWRVQWGRKRGWTAECDADEYWLEEV